MKSPTTYLTRVTEACGNHVTRAQQLCNLWKKYIYKTLKSKYHALMKWWFISEWKLGQFQISVLLITLVSCLKSGWNTRTCVHLSSFVLYCSFCNIIVIHYCWRISDWIPWLQRQHSIQTMLLRKIPLHEVKRMSVFNRKKTRTLFGET